jgi:hypothetical protein
MAYTGRGNTGNRDGHGWAIAGAFAGQAAIIVGIGALLAGAGTTAAVTQVSAVPAPAIAAPKPAFSLMPDIQPLTGGSPYYQLNIDGQNGSNVFPDALSAPSFLVQPGQDLTVALDVTIPSGQSLTGMSVSLIGASGTGTPGVTPPDNAFSVQPLSPGTHVFVLSWPGSAGELRPGTHWSLFMSAGADGGAAIARINVAS